jgi:hypothetical protein
MTATTTATTTTAVSVPVILGKVVERGPPQVNADYTKDDKADNEFKGCHGLYFTLRRLNT